MDCSLEEESKRLISLFHELIESEECQGLQYQCLLAPLTSIITNKIALEKMCQLNTVGFESIYNQHFIEKRWGCVTIKTENQVNLTHNAARAH